MGRHRERRRVVGNEEFRRLAMTAKAVVCVYEGTEFDYDDREVQGLFRNLRDRLSKVIIGDRAGDRKRRKEGRRNGEKVFSGCSGRMHRTAGGGTL